MKANRDKQTGRELIDLVHDTGNTDYVKGGKVYRNAPIKTVLVGGASDLELLKGYEPGTVAYTAGFKKLWQLGTDDTWTSMEG